MCAPDTLHVIETGIQGSHLLPMAMEMLVDHYGTSAIAQLDMKYKNLPRHRDLHHFANGVSNGTLFTGHEYNMMFR
ncbi:hypothetical protein HDU93_006782, partial [Gonapodya sp. JEL0774]